MYIKSMILDGFKSYKNRVEIHGFDKEFNAITGLNGSGKSNILDAICFVLGITTLGHVRVTSLQELVYKSGQAGKKTASVTITFANNIKEKSPPGYENYDEITVTRQIIIDGKNKYLINGVNVTNKRVQDMFCSIQLNVNNPHFLIMQGRITKVLNMKPLEILSMLEEAAGTRMFEEKKEAAMKMIGKKNTRLAEINALLTEEITPKLQKLKQEKAQFVEFQRVERELEHCKRIVIAWKYLSAVKESEEVESKITNVKGEITKKKETIKTGKDEIVEIGEKIEELLKIIEEEKKGSVENDEKDLKALEKNHTKLLAEANSNLACINAEEKHIELVKQNITDDEKMLKQKEEELANDGAKFEELKAREGEDAAEVLRAQEKYQKISSGLLESDTGENATLEQQLIKAKRLASDAQTEIKQCEMTLIHNKELLKKKQAELKSLSDDLKKGKMLEEEEKKLKVLDSQINKINYDENSLGELRKERQNLINEIRSIQDKIEGFESNYPQLRFDYQNPHPNFDRNSVKGLVCSLIQLKKKEAAYALEVTAGSRLYNVVVDTEKTSKALLQNGQLQKRVTIIPLNKISGRCIDDGTLQVAQKLVGKENVQTAFSLIECANRDKPAMAWIFGQTLVCKDLSVAKKVAFHEKIMKKCVTLQGDVCDPSGTLSGGAAPQSGSILLQMDTLKTFKESLAEKEAQLQEMNQKFEGLTKLHEKYTTLKHQFDLKKHEVNMLRQTVEQTPYHQVKSEVKNLEEEIVELKNKMESAKIVKAENEKRAQQLENQLKDSTNIREKQLKDAENQLKAAQKKAEISKKEWQKYERSAEMLDLELSELKKSIENGKNQLKTIEDKIKELKVKDDEYQTELNDMSRKITELQDKIKLHKNETMKKNKEIQKLEGRKEDILKQNNDYELDIKKLTHELTSIKNDMQQYSQRVADLVRKNPWINQDKAYFGEPGGIFDFTVNDPEAMTQKLVGLENIRDKLSRTVNVRAMNLLAKEEERHSKAIERRKIVENDKNKILKTIEVLEDKKKVAIQTAWERVNQDFGSIFSTLLPGADAKLQPVSKNVLDGLEIKVGFTGIWKESLGELSGGQRSLVALSLILAMLLFKPAPVYILDEVDAALDLSHTQNIGTMLKKHFKHSQFIIVSLKDGMFNNANVLYTTTFVDGMSMVTRTQRTSNH